MLRELFEDHYKLADRFEAAAQQISIVERSLHGTEGHQGTTELLLNAAEQCRLGAAAVSQLNVVELAAAVAQLNEQTKALPHQLLRPEESQAFRESLERALLSDTTRILRVAYEAAMKSGCLEAVEHALREMQKRIDTTELEKVTKALNAARQQNSALNNKISLLNSQSVGKLQAAVKWSVTSFFTGIALGTALSMLYLAPQINKFINP
ncbi:MULTISPECIES: hypothetical protein [Pseudomonadaceae]|uniref:Uncharacterized protein n=3 Tax=Pseudomonadaceae TaxID=135621 RepID=W6RKM6_ECTO5|nr:MULTISPECIES: hypothetical protein [Pseudomonas]CDR92983.1 hypothetical protein PPSAL_3759 [Pseudomonas oleovorans]EKU1957812.1 hypothetical protein [Pseudomonas aeruginosa]EMB2852116.1 hypothetical protein [Pseudomonas aeruginosa]MDM9653452.1 hypothetical protein [Pseudomonas wenzhouensis]MDS9696846.1 hypothetical protein [Pseudomonas aeruginosa]